MLPSDRCGVSSAENSVGSAAMAAWTLLSLMRSSLYRLHGTQDDPQSRKQASPDSKARQAESGQAEVWQAEVLDAGRGRGGVSPLQEGEPGADHRAEVGQPVHAAGGRG